MTADGGDFVEHGYLMTGTACLRRPLACRDSRDVTPAKQQAANGITDVQLKHAQ